jgi:hypothetical protein
MICSRRSSAAIRGACLGSAESTLFFNVITGGIELIFFQPSSFLSTFIFSFSIHLFFQHSSRNAARATLFCKYALTYHSLARSGKLNFQAAAFQAPQWPHMSRRDAAVAVRSPASRPQASCFTAAQATNKFGAYAAVKVRIVGVWP